MTLPVANEFGYCLTNDLDPASGILGVTLTPGQNSFPTPTAVFDNVATHSWWPADSDDAYGIEIEFSGVGSSTLAKDALARIYYQSAVSGVDVVNNELDYATPHGLETADGPITLGTTGVAPGGLATATDYWAINRGKTSFAVATSEANARAGIAIDITDAGSGVHTTTACKIRDLSASSAGPSSGNALTGGRRYFFPLWIPRLTKIMASVSVNNATVGSAGCWLKLYAKPTKPWALRTITFVRTFGSTPASSSGTAITPGTNADGAYFEIGTLQEEIAFWSMGPCINQAVMGNSPQSWDLALGTAITKRNVIENDEWGTSASEIMAQVGLGWVFALGAAGEKCYVRSAYAGTPVSGFSVVVYGGGGRFVPDGSYAVSGSVTLDGVAVSQLGGIDIFAVDQDNVSDLVSAGVDVVAGVFSFLAPDNVRNYFAVTTITAVDGTFRGVSASGQPGIDEFNVSLSRGTTTASRVISVTTTQLGRLIPVVARITVASGLLPWIVLSTGDFDEHLIFNPTRPVSASQSGDQRWLPSFRERSSVVQDGNELVITILPNGGWSRENFKLIFVAGAEIVLGV